MNRAGVALPGRVVSGKITGGGNDGNFRAFGFMKSVLHRVERIFFIKVSIQELGVVSVVSRVRSKFASCVGGSGFQVSRNRVQRSWTLTIEGWK